MTKNLAVSLAIVLFATTLQAQNKIDLSRQIKGTLPAGNLPAPSGSTLGGVKSIDCTGVPGHVLKIDTTGTPTCSVDSGFANPLTTLGDTLYGGASGAPTRLAGDVSNTRKFLLSLSSGGVAAAPSWVTLVSGDIPNNGANTTGNAGTATALAANGGNCGANQYSQGVDASGVAEGCSQPSTATLSDNSIVVKNNQANTFGAFLQKFRAGANFQLGDPTDFTKLAQFDLSNISTATTRTINVPDANSTLAQSFALVSHQFLTDMSAQGVHHAAQPACSDLSNGAPSCSTDTTNAANISSGTLPGARMPALTGDTTMAVNTTVTTTGKVNGVTYPSAPSINQVPVVTSAASGGTTTYEAVPNAALANSSVTVAVAAPITGGGSGSLGGSAPAVGCTTCATTTNGGPLSGTAPITVSAGGAIGITTPLSVANGGTGAATAAANTVFGNNTGSTAAPGFQSLVGAQLPLTIPAQDYSDTWWACSKYAGASLDAIATTCMAAVSGIFTVAGGVADLSGITGAQNWNNVVVVPLGMDLKLPPVTITPSSLLSCTIAASGLVTSGGTLSVTCTTAMNVAVGNNVRFEGTTDPNLNGSLCKVTTVTQTSNPAQFSCGSLPIPSNGATVASSETLSGGTAGLFDIQYAAGAHIHGGSSSHLSSQSVTKLIAPAGGGGLITNTLNTTISEVEIDHLWLSTNTANTGVGIDPSSSEEMSIHDVQFFNFFDAIYNGQSCNAANNACYYGKLDHVSINVGGGTCGIHLRGAANSWLIQGESEILAGPNHVCLGGGFGQLDTNPPNDMTDVSIDNESQVGIATAGAPTVGCGSGTGTSFGAKIAYYGVGGPGAASTETVQASCGATNLTVTMPGTALPVGTFGYVVYVSSPSGSGWTDQTANGSGTCNNTTVYNGKTICLASAVWTESGALTASTAAPYPLTAGGALPIAATFQVIQGLGLKVIGGRKEANYLNFHTFPNATAQIEVENAYRTTTDTFDRLDENGRISNVGMGSNDWLSYSSGVQAQSLNLIDNASFEGGWWSASFPPTGWRAVSGSNVSPAPASNIYCAKDSTAANIDSGSFDLQFGNPLNAANHTQGCATDQIIKIDPANPYTLSFILNNQNNGTPTKARLWFYAYDSNLAAITDASLSLQVTSPAAGLPPGLGASAAAWGYSTNCNCYQIGSDVFPAAAGTAQRFTYFIHFPPNFAGVRFAFVPISNDGTAAHNVMFMDSLTFAEGRILWFPDLSKTANSFNEQKPFGDSDNGGVTKPLPSSFQTGAGMWSGTQYWNASGSTINSGAAVKADTGNADFIKEVAAADGNAFVGVVGVNEGSCATGAMCSIATAGVIQDAVSDGACAIGNYVQPSTTLHDVHCTATAGAGNFGIALNAVNGAGFHFALRSQPGLGLGDLSSSDYAAGGGTAQAQTVTLAPAAGALVTGMEVRWLPAAANTGAAPTLAVNGLTAKPITKFGTAALLANDLQTNAPADAIYDGTEFILLNPQTPSIAGIHTTGLTAAVSTATLCASTAAACATAGHYHIHWDMWGSGTACSSVTAGSVTFLLTWTDANAVVHSAVALQMMGQTGAATEAMGNTFPFQTALANESASGDFNVSTNGAIIQYATGYTACTTGTGTYNLDVTVQRNE